MQRIVIFCSIILCQRRAWLHRIGNQPVVGNVHFDHGGGGFNSSICCRLIADLPVENNIVFCFRVQLRCALFDSVFGTDHGLKDLVINFDCLSCSLGFRQAFRDHDSDRITYIAHMFCRQSRPSPHIHRRTVFGMDHPAANNVADTVTGKLFSIKNSNHTGHHACGFAVDLLDFGVGVGRAHKCGKMHASHFVIIRITAHAGDESLIFLAQYPCADTFNSHKIFLHKSATMNGCSIYLFFS